MRGYETTNQKSSTDTDYVHGAFRKKINKLAKEKGCDIIGEWSKSMVNHLYWCALSTNDGDGEVMLEKWLSLLNHIHNKHRGHGKVYKKCTHGRLRGRKWLKRRKLSVCNIVATMTAMM